MKNSLTLKAFTALILSVFPLCQINTVFVDANEELSQNQTSDDTNLISSVLNTAPLLTRNGNTSFVRLDIYYSGSDVVNAISCPQIDIYDSNYLTGTYYGSSNHYNRTVFTSTQSGTYVTFYIPSSIYIPTTVTSARAVANGGVFVYSTSVGDWISTTFTTSTVYIQ